MKKNIIILLLISCLSSCKKEKKPINIQNALVDCLQKNGNDYGIMLFGDSMLNFPSSHIMSFVSSLTNTYQGLGNSSYPTKTNFINNKGSFLNSNDGATLLDVNRQNSILGQPEWAGRLGYLNGTGQNITFVTGGVFPIANTTKIFILTDTINIGTYDIQRSTDQGSTWTTSVSNDTTLESVKGMKVHAFDDTSETIRIGYRVLWKSGQVMCLDPLFLKAGGNNIYHITVGSGGADFKLQTSIPKERIQFLIDEANIKIVTSSHRYEVANVTEFRTYQNLMDEWWKGKNIDVLYFGQPPQTNDSAVADKLKRDVNNEIFLKSIEKEYLYYDMYKTMGGLQKVIDLGWGSSDPVHLTFKSYANIAPKLLYYLEFNDQKYSTKKK